MFHFYRCSMDKAAGLRALLTVLLRGEVYEAQSAHIYSTNRLTF
jgi:hypothetical protein